MVKIYAIAALWQGAVPAPIKAWGGGRMANFAHSPSPLGWKKKCAKLA